MTSKSSLTPKIATLCRFLRSYRTSESSTQSTQSESAESDRKGFFSRALGMIHKLRPGTRWAMASSLSFFFLVGGLEHALFSTIYEIILPIDFHMFQDGYCTTKQFLFGSECTKRLTISKYFIDHWRLVESHGNATRTCLYYYSMSYIYINTHIYIYSTVLQCMRIHLGKLLRLHCFPSLEYWSVQGELFQ